jgi:hypothetical protein
MDRFLAGSNSKETEKAVGILVHGTANDMQFWDCCRAAAPAKVPIGAEEHS